MRFGVNLRGDVAKLSDGELASRLEILLDRRQELAAMLRSFDRIGYWLYEQKVMLFGRGPLHARIFYKLWAWLNEGPLDGRSFGDLHVLDCEIKEIADEMQRRVSARRTAARASP